ncbi:MAG: GHKL domain-containing protein [Bacteroidales bacterium]|nr:GHKL domain-containing protein [Bacteroidales bacterium]
METDYASAERASASEIGKAFVNLGKFKYVNEIVDALPFIAVIVNQQRQIVFASHTLLKLLGISDFDDILGKRPGELLHCVNSTEKAAGCGTTETCRYCGAVNAILQCIASDSRITNECRITAREDGHEVSYDFSITAAPFHFQDEQFVILSFIDIGNEKRRKMLERIFYHDIINTAGGLRGFIGFLRNTSDVVEQQEFLSVADQLSNALLDEIQSQRVLLMAENGELIPEYKSIIPAGFLGEVANFMRHHHVALDKTIEIDENASPKQFVTDPELLRRVLVNLLKNALEASKKGEKVQMGCDREDGKLVFWVHNAAFMPRDVQLQLFQRSFSTKGENRGIGTYSIKLLTEHYLKGKVVFSSDPVKGTTFRAEFTNAIQK